MSNQNPAEAGALGWGLIALESLICASFHNTAIGCRLLSRVSWDTFVLSIPSPEHPNCITAGGWIYYYHEHYGHSN